MSRQNICLLPQCVLDLIGDFAGTGDLVLRFNVRHNVVLDIYVLNRRPGLIGSRYNRLTNSNWVVTSYYPSRKEVYDKYFGNTTDSCLISDSIFFWEPAEKIHDLIGELERLMLKASEKEYSLTFHRNH